MTTYTAATLFDAPPARGSSRRSDPQTSRDAARSVAGPVLRDQQWVVLYLNERGGRSRGGATAWETWLMGNGANNNRAIKENVISKRLGELAALGMVRLTGETRPGSSCRHQQVYEVTDAGRSALAGRSWLEGMGK